VDTEEMPLRLVVALLFCSLAAFAQPAPRPDIVALLDATGSIDALDKLFTPETMEAQMRTMMKPESAPPDQRAKMERFIKEFSKEFSGEVKQQRQALLDLIIAIHAKHYTPDDVKAIIAFYQTPVGKKMAGLAVKLSMETMQTAQAWGQEIGQRVGQKVGQRIEAEEKEKK
jgi:hypothetical protein